MERPIEAALEINTLLQEYYNKTAEIRDLIQKNEDAGFVETLNNLIKSRDQLIAHCDRLKAIWEEQKLFVDETSADYRKIMDDRSVILGRINILEEQNAKSLNTLKNVQTNGIKQINQGRRVYNAYQPYSPSTDGIFIDKKK